MVRTELHTAAMVGDLEKVMDLVENKGFNVEEKDDGSLCTPLHWAVIHGHLKVVKYLVEQAHANVEAKVVLNWTPLQHAATNGRFEVVKYLVEEAGADIWAKNNSDKLACDVASKEEIKEYLKSVMEDGEGGLTMTKSAAFKKEEE